MSAILVIAVVLLGLAVFSAMAFADDSLTVVDLPPEDDWSSESPDSTKQPEA